MRGYTLLELLIVMFVLGILIGSAMLLAGRLDPGPAGLHAAASAFFESSRDRARASGRPVVIEIEPEAGGLGRLRRLVFRVAREASFESGSEARDGLQASAGGAMVGQRPGRFGAALALDGGSVAVAGRGGRIAVADGFGVELQVWPEGERSSLLLRWPALLDLRLGRDGALRVRLELAEGGAIDLATLAGALAPRRWHHLAVDAADGLVSLRVDGRLAASDSYGAALAEPAGDPLLGDPDGAFTGLIDELAIWTRVVERGPELREEANLMMSAPRVVFGPDGLLDPALGAAVRVELIDRDEPVEAFLVGRFAEEELGS